MPQTCNDVPCGNGGTERMQVTEDTRTGNTIDTHIVCRPPGDVDIAALARDEFAKNTVTVPEPEVAPQATTLVNFPNVLAVDVRSYTQPAAITVADVRITFIPTTFRWTFGDGATLTTTNPGKPYDPHHHLATVDDVERQYPVTHRYAQLGTFALTVTVTYTGQYSVNGGPWTDIEGTLTATSPRHTLIVQQARSQLIADN